jgi:hypothetical protein
MHWPPQLNTPLKACFGKLYTACHVAVFRKLYADLTLLPWTLSAASATFIVAAIFCPQGALRTKSVKIFTRLSVRAGSARPGAKLIG